MTVQVRLNEKDLEMLFKQFLENNFSKTPEKIEIRTPDYISIDEIVLEF